MRMRSARVALGVAAAAVWAAGACSLAEVAAPAGDDTLVVEAVLRTDHLEQLVLLHRSIVGSTVRGEPGARVTLTRDDGAALTLRQAPDGVCTFVDPGYFTSDSVQVHATCYTTEGSGVPVPPGQPQPAFVVPGRTYLLRVETARGEVAQGRTRVPGGFHLGFPLGLPGPDHVPHCALPADTNVTLTWSRADSAWSYLARMQVDGLGEALRARGDSVGGVVPNPFELLGLSISAADTTVVLPREFGVFDRLTQNLDVLRILQRGFPAGLRVSLIVAAADRNYVNSIRGGRFNPSGQARISSIVGSGVGVFGSLVPLYAVVDVREPGPGDAPCLPL
ncbi:MAG: hypothetical protein JWM27_3993 [Gemmatimonadetes bacterium]|nr:hypothetical protein [Gemmatimonadota bacterium]